MTLLAEDVLEEGLDVVLGELLIALAFTLARLVMVIIVVIGGRIVC